MKIYTIIWDDRHADATAHTFSKPELAISEAKRMAKKYARENEDYNEHHRYVNEKMIFHVTYSCENNGLTVWATELDELLDGGK